MSDPKQRRISLTTNAAICALLAGSLVTSGCLFGKKKTVKVFTPPPVVAKVPPSNKPPVLLVTLPETEPEIEQQGSVPVPVATLPPGPPRPAPPKPTAPPKPPPVTVEIPSAPAPKPATIFSADERRRLTQELDDRLDRVRRALARVEGKSLSGDLIALANNARAFLAQAEQARAQDLVTAVNLAKRADLFAADLVSRLP